MSVKNNKKSRRSKAKAKGRENGHAENGENEYDDSDSSGSDEEPDVADLENSEICPDNHATCIKDDIDAVLEVFDEETCVNLLIGYYEGASMYHLVNIN